MPLYYQVESVLRDELAAHRYADGTPLPTEDALIRRFGVSRITVRRALERLTQEGLIYRVPGRGTFATARRALEFRIERNPADLMGFEQDIRRAGLTPDARVLRHDWVRVPADVALALGIPADAEVLWLHRLGSVGGQPLWIEDRYVTRPWAVRLKPRDYAVPSLLSTLATSHGFTVDRGRVRIAAGAAGRGEARLLNVRSGAPLLVAEFAVQANGNPAQFVRASFRPDRYAFAFDVEAETPLRRRAARREGVRDGH
ncbi:MAG: GntR family transcriptional regulator [Armatimonadota bacterium]|nr:GntR family transcriptional regulator [Armatimonadota bacterium]